MKAKNDMRWNTGMFVRLLLAAAIFHTAITWAADNDPILIRYVPRGADENQVINLIQRIFYERSWKVVGTTTTSVSGELEHNGYNAKVTIYREGDALLYHDVTTEWRQDPHGSRFSRIEGPTKAPERWIENLRVDLTTQLALLPIAHSNDKTSPADATERMRSLKKMLDDGLINQQDYDNKKTAILNGL